MRRRLTRFLLRWPTPLYEAAYDHFMNDKPLRWHERLRYLLLLGAQ